MAEYQNTSLKIVSSTTLALGRALVNGSGALAKTVSYKFGGVVMAWGGTIEFSGASIEAEVDCYAGTIETEDPAPVKQVETATAAGTITVAGKARLIVTMDSISRPVDFDVLVGDTASVWAGKARAAALLNGNVTSVCDISGSGTSIVGTRKAGGNDGTFNISLADFTSEGITEAATSANTTAGVAGIVVTGGDGKDLEGNTLVSPGPLNVVMIENKGPSSVIMTASAFGPSGLYELFGGSVFVAGGDYVGGWSDLTIQSQGDAVVDLIVYGEQD